MYKSKHMRKANVKRTIIIAASVILMIAISLGATLAYITDETPSIANIFNPSKVTTAVVEVTTGDPVSGVQIANTNDTQAYIRAAVVVTWQNANGDVYAVSPVEGTDYSMNWIGLTDMSWDEGSDGYYYYTQPVDPVDNGVQYTTSTLFKGLEQKTEAPADGFSLNVEVIGSGIQSTPTRVVVENWGVTLADDGVTIGK